MMWLGLGCAFVLGFVVAYVRTTLQRWRERTELAKLLRACLRAGALDRIEAVARILEEAGVP